MYTCVCMLHICCVFYACIHVCVSTHMHGLHVEVTEHHVAPPFQPFSLK